jgi:DNA-binding Xre family transcriptional regulator
MINTLNLKILMVEKSLSSGELAKRINVAPNTISRLTNNGRGSLDVINKVCKALACTPNDIWDLEVLNEKKK